MTGKEIEELRQIKENHKADSAVQELKRKDVEAVKANAEDRAIISPEFPVDLNISWNDNCVTHVSCMVIEFCK